MKLKAIAISMLVASAIVGCDQHVPFAMTAKPPVQAGSHWTRTPTLPIIQAAVNSLVPTFNGQSVPAAVMQLCALAQGVSTQDQVNAQLAKMGVDVTRLPRDAKDARALLVNGDRAGQAIACAAYQAYVVTAPITPSDVVHDVKVPVPQAAKEEKSAKAGQVKEKESVAYETRQEIDQGAMGRLFRVRIAQARASADIYAYIAERLAETRGLTVAQYQAKARELFASMAPAYLQLVQRYLPPESTVYRLEQADPMETAFSTDGGMRYKASRMDGLTFMQNGQLWLGAGHILGNDYRVRASYFQPAQAQVATAKQ